ncbi:MAG: DUF2235 domain-containing protein [Pseudomonadota bacterium]
MGRKLIICMDGNGNEVGFEQTNILRLYQSLKKDSDTQLAYYVPGVGTNDAQKIAGAATQKVRGLAGLAFGLGLEDNVLKAFRFLCQNYQKGDDILCFGFSRGAYTVRVLAGFLHNFGLMRPNELHLAPRVFRAYRQLSYKSEDMKADLRYQHLREYGKAIDASVVPIRYLGLFDTVSSIIRIRKPVRNLISKKAIIEYGTHKNVDKNVSVKMVRHALAIDEKRAMFRAQHWIKTDYYGNRFKTGAAQEQDVKQMWFAGYHSDVGGSPPEDRAGIGKLSLSWMLDELAEAGLALEFRRNAKERYILGEDEDARTPGDLQYSKPDPMAPIHDSLESKWRFAEWLPKSRDRREPPNTGKGSLWYLPRGEARFIPEDHLIHPSVFERREQSDYDPENLKGRDA